MSSRPKVAPRPLQSGNELPHSKTRSINANDVDLGTLGEGWVVSWSAIYDGPSGKGAVTYVLDVPPDDDWRTRYWDVADRYRKHYLVTFLGSTVPANREFYYRVVTTPFEANQQQWKMEAARIAEACKAIR